jgi:hypothetical protein
MIRKSFKDIDGKNGKVGSIVIESYCGRELSGEKTVKQIINKGIAGTWIYFEEGNYGKATNYKIVKE